MGRFRLVISLDRFIRFAFHVFGSRGESSLLLNLCIFSISMVSLITSEEGKTYVLLGFSKTVQ